MGCPTSFSELVRRYVGERRTLGFGLSVAGQQLQAFARFMDSHPTSEPLTVKRAVDWARASKRLSPLTWGRRIEVVRPFASWLRQHDPRTEVPPPNLFGRTRRRLPPHVYAEEEIIRILEEAARLSPRGGIRPVTVATLLALLSCTGMRVSEALALEFADVDLDEGVLHVRLTKFRKSRLVPLHPTAVEALDRYVARRATVSPSARHAPFFVVDSGARLTYSKVRTAFRRIRIRLGWQDRPGRRPRVHDLRHDAESRIMPSGMVRIPSRVGSPPFLACWGRLNSA